MLETEYNRSFAGNMEVQQRQWITSVETKTLMLISQF